MTTSKGSNINVDVKLKERLKMFEEIDKIVKIEKLNPCSKESKDEISNLDNSSLYNYSEKNVSKINEYTENNINLPMQTNRNNNINKKGKVNDNINIKIKNPTTEIFLNSETDNCFVKNTYINSNANYNTNNNYNTNSNYVESTNELKSFLPTPENDSIHIREKEKYNIIQKNYINNKNVNKINLQNNIQNENIKEINSNFNLYKKKNILNRDIPRYSSKSPQKNLGNLSDFDNTSYDYPQQIKKENLGKNSSMKKTNNPQNSNSTFDNTNNNNTVNKFLNNQTENPFHKNISNELNSLGNNNNNKNKSTEKILNKKSNFSNYKNNIKVNYESSNPNICKNSTKYSLSTYENTCNNTPHLKNQKANIMKKEIKKDFVECFEYDFYNFPLIKNIPDSKIIEIEKQKNYEMQQQRNLYSEHNYNTANKNNYENNYLTPHKNTITDFINKNTSNKTNRNLEIFLNTKSKNNSNLNTITNTNKKSMNKTFDKSNRNNSRSRSKTRENSMYKSKQNTPNNKKLRNLKKFIMNSKDPNFGERLYNYNIYYNVKLKNKLEEENLQRIRSATPKITRKAKNLQRDKKKFHERLYPFTNNDDNNDNNELNVFKSNSKVNSSCEINNNNYKENRGIKMDNENFEKIYNNVIDDEHINIVYDKNFLYGDIYNYHEQGNKRSHSSNDLINKSKENIIMNKALNKNNYFVNNYNKNIFEKKTHEDKNMNFKPNLNKKSLQIASKFGPALERLYPKKGRRSSKNLLNLDNQNNNNSIINSPKSHFSNFSDISKRSLSPNIYNKPKSLSNNKINSKVNHSNKKEAIERQHDLYKKGLEKMKKREEKSKEKKIIESETYKQFSYKPKINTNFSSNIRTIYKTPKSIQGNININLDNDKNIKDETLILENNLMGSPITNHNFINNLNSEEINIIDYSGIKNNNSNLNISDIERFKNIYEKNLIWKKKIANQSERIRTSEEKKILETLTFQPQINKNEMKNDEKFIEKNLDQIQDYVNKRRANLKKQKLDEELKKRKFNFGQNFVIKPTIPKEFNLHTAKKLSSDKNTFNKSNISNINNISNISCVNNPVNEKSPIRKNSNTSFCDGVNRSRSNSYLKSNKNNSNNFDINNINSENVNNIRNQLNIQNFFSEDNKLNLDEEENQNFNYLKENEKLFYLQNEYSQQQCNEYFLKNQQNIYEENLYFNNIPNSQRMPNNNKGSYSNYHSNPNLNKNQLNAQENNKKIKIFNMYQTNNLDNQSFKNNFHNDFIGYNGQNNQQHFHQENQEDQLAFVNAINNLHEKLVNLNI